MLSPMKLLLLPICLLMMAACHNSKDRVQPDTSIYKTITLDTVQVQLSKVIEETSGLARVDSTFWTLNDSGGEPALYQFDPISGEVLRTVMLSGAENKDWEDMTTDSTYVYVGNFGNNFGNRKDLKIYKARISDLLAQDEIEVEEIEFSYPDQETFSNGYGHNHDCESIIAYGDSLYLFSKNWQDMRTKLYSLPKTPGSYVAHMISTVDTRGTLTAAALSDDQSKLFLLGYNPGDGFDPFVWTVSDWQGSDFLTGKMERTNISNRRQTEAIVMADESTLYISAENEQGGYPILYKLNL
jgi:hypothetical protein